MAQRIEIKAKLSDSRAKVRKKKLQSLGFADKINDVQLVDVYTVDSVLDASQLEKVASMLVNPVTQDYKVAQPLTPEKFDWAIEVGFLPGVTDNVANTTKEGIEDLFKTKLNPAEGAYTSQVTFLSGDLTKSDVEEIAGNLANKVIERVYIKSYDDFLKGGMDVVVPKVKIDQLPKADIVDILNVDDSELKRIGKMGVFDHDRELNVNEYLQLRKLYQNDELKLGDLLKKDDKYFQKVRRGPLALDLTYMKTIQDYFKEQNRNPSDIELESIAQTWSEHCKHTIFADPIDEFEDGLFNTFIKGATDTIRRKKGDKDFCVSVFKDNSGGIVFDERYLIGDKVETHNAPSALDPYGGSITGIVGVDRDAMGFGLGAKPFNHRFGYCFADPRPKQKIIDPSGTFADPKRRDARIIDRVWPTQKGKDPAQIIPDVFFKDEALTQKMLSPRQIMDGVIDGVNFGGNCSGIPTPQGFMFFDKRYKGKPLVYVGVQSLIPRESAGRPSHEKQAQPGDYIVMAGGRVGEDGVHGATFSSEAMDSGSPVTAVQIGDPITQKKLSDAIVKEARDLGLYTSITDNGAGGLSCSVAEMAKECGGCHVELDKVPLKYPGLTPWKTWISESQERMTLSVPKEKWNQFSDLMKRRGVEATVIGEFNDSNKCIVEYAKTTIMDIDMNFLHDGLPARPITTTYTPAVYDEPDIPLLEDLTNSLHSMLSRPNMASFEFISQQYDHEVQGGSVIKPLQGKGRVNGNATVTKPVLDSEKAVVSSQGINPSYSDIDTYHMAACAIDTAIRNAVSVGANLDHLALLDNFCWCSSDEPERLGQLKRAVQACYDYATAYGTPFISGKDSMFNDFKGYDENGTPIKISVPPTLLVSSVGVMQDAKKAVSLDAKFADDLVYILGETNDELGASEYLAMKGEELRNEKYIGNAVPKVDPKKNNKVYRALSKAVDEEFVASAQSVERGGLAVALAKTSMGGKLGMDIYLENIPGSSSRDDFSVFSESQGRLVVTINPDYKEEFENIMKGNAFAQIGVVRADNKFIVHGEEGKEIINTNADNLLNSYKTTFEDF